MSDETATGPMEEDGYQYKLDGSMRRLAVTAHLPGWRVTARCYRPLVDYAQALPNANSPKDFTFAKWLNDGNFARERDDRLLLPLPPGVTDPPSCEFGNLHDLIEVHGKESVNHVELALTHNPEDVIVLPDNV